VDFLELTHSLGGRLLLLIPLAYCIFVLLDSQDRNVRLAAIIALALIEQVREWLLVSGIKGAASGKGHSNKKT